MNRSSTRRHQRPTGWLRRLAWLCALGLLAGLPLPASLGAAARAETDTEERAPVEAPDKAGDEAAKAPWTHARRCPRAGRAGPNAPTRLPLSATPGASEPAGASLVGCTPFERGLRPPLRC